MNEIIYEKMVNLNISNTKIHIRLNCLACLNFLDAKSMKGGFKNKTK